MFVKPALQAVLLVFGLCGSFVVLVWVVLWFLVTCGFLALVCASYCSLWFLWVGGLALDAEADGCASDRTHVVFCGSAVLPSMLDADGCASSCSLWTAKKICPSPHFVLCSISSPLEATFTNGENDHG